MTITPEPAGPAAKEGVRDAYRSRFGPSSSGECQGYTFQTQLGLWMGMNHMNGRVEDAITGRMLSADPHVPDRTNPQSYNRFTYVNNNPLTLTDPSGFCTPRWACKQDAGGGASWAARHGLSFDPGSLLGTAPAMGSPQGVSGFDVTLCDGCSTGSDISNGLTDVQETAMLATGATATANFAGGVTPPSLGPTVTSQC